MHFTCARHHADCCIRPISFNPQNNVPGLLCYLHPFYNQKTEAQITEWHTQGLIPKLFPKTWKEQELRCTSRQTESRGSVLHHWSVMTPKWNLPFSPYLPCGSSPNLVALYVFPPNPQISNLAVPTLVHSYLDDSPLIAFQITSWSRNSQVISFQRFLQPVPHSKLNTQQARPSTT